MVRLVFRYALFGVLFGSVFPLFAWGIDISIDGLNFSIASIVEIHREDPLHYIIDIAPVVLGTAFYFMGRKQQQLIDLTHRLKDDVSARSQALSRSEERMRDFTDTPNQRFWETDADHVFTYVSGGIGGVFMHSVDRSIGLKRWELPGVSAPEEAWIEHKADIEARRPIVDFRCVQTAEGGEKKYLSINGHPFYDDDGHFVGYRGTTTDVTQQQTAAASIEQSEEKYRHLFEYAEDSIFILDQDTRKFLDVNRAAARRLGYTVDQLIGMTVTDINLQDSTPQDTAKRFKTIREQGSATYETSHVRRDGSIMPVEISSRFVRYGDREVLESMVRDISERKEMERMKSEFISTVSHELRTPLTSIIASLGLMRANQLGDMPDTMRQMVEVAHSNSERLVRLINDILDVEKIESGNMEFNMEPIDLNALLEQAIVENESYAGQFGVILSKAADIPNASVTGDWHRLLQVMANLLSNASKFSPPGSLINVKLVPNGQTVRVAVADKGPGIDEIFRDRLFDKFTQSDMSDSKEKGGTGLGLSISKSIVEIHGGEIGFENNNDGGSTFFFDLPREAA